MNLETTTTRVGIQLLASLFPLVLAGCDGAGSASGPRDGTGMCSIPEDQLIDGGVGRDAIPALNDPVLVEAGEPGGDYLGERERVIGLVVDGQAIAIPHRIGWIHEIVNLDLGDRRVAVTYCPLTGSSLVFDRSAAGGANFGVSGLLFRNNLIMFDRSSQESLWPQMSRGARCGPRDGTPLEMVPSVEMTWDRWTSLHPDTRLPGHLPGEGQSFKSYTYPYGNYEERDNETLLFPMRGRLDRRRQPKERVLGIPGIPLAFPFLELASGDGPTVAAADVGDRNVVVFWDDEGRGAGAHYPTSGGRELEFVVRDGAIVDTETGSTWTVEGRAVAGPMAGRELEPIPEAHVAFWFAWAAFHPGTGLWTADGGVPEF